MRYHHHIINIIRRYSSEVLFLKKVGESSIQIQNLASSVCVWVKLFRYIWRHLRSSSSSSSTSVLLSSVYTVFSQFSMHKSTNANHYNIPTSVPVAVCFLDTFSFHVRGARCNCSIIDAPCRFYYCLVGKAAAAPKTTLCAHRQFLFWVLYVQNVGMLLH